MRRREVCGSRRNYHSPAEGEALTEGEMTQEEAIFRSKIGSSGTPCSNDTRIGTGT